MYDNSAAMGIMRWHERKRNWLRLIAVAGLAILPWVYWPWAAVVYEVPKVWFMWLWVGAMAVFGLGMMVAGGRVNRVQTVWWVLVLGFMGVMGLSSVLGVDRYKSLLGNFYRGDGLVTLLVMVLWTVVMRLWAREGWWRQLAYGVVVGAVGSSVWAVAEAVAWYGFKTPIVSGWGGAQGAGFGQPVFLAGYLVVSLPMVAYVVSGVWRKIVYGLLALGIVVTQAWGGILGVGVFVVLQAIETMRQKQETLRQARSTAKSMKQENTAFFVRVGLVGGMLLIGVVGVLVLRSTNGFVAEGRQRIVARALLAWERRPVFGYGVANVDHALESVVWPLPILHDVYVDKAHSSVLEVLVTGGVVGLLWWMMVNGYVGLQLKRMIEGGGEKAVWGKTLLMVWVLYLVHSQTNVTSIAEEMMWWMVVGMAGVSLH